MDETIATYDRSAARFAASWGSLRLERALSAFSSRIGDPRRVLDLGCGPGRDADHLTKLGCWVVGLDLSSGMLAEARRNLPATPLVQADLRDPPFASSSFDGVWACASLLHLARNQLPCALLGLGRLLRQSNGVLYLALKVGQGEHWSANRDGRRSFFSFYQLPEIKAMLAETGFQVLEDWVAPDEGGRDRPWLNVIARMRD